MKSTNGDEVEEMTAVEEVRKEESTLFKEDVERRRLWGEGIQRGERRG